MLCRRPILLTLVASLALLASAAQAATTVQNVRIWAENGKTRVVLDLDRAGAHSIFTLRGPDRLVVDLKDGRLSNALKALPRGVGSVKAIRSSVQPNGQLRVVLDLNQSVRSRSFTTGPNSQYADRLVIDLQPSGNLQTVKRASEGYQPGRDIVIAIDPGHGGHDPGAVGKGKTREKDVALAVSKQLAARINAEPGMKAILIRSGDYYIPLRDRFEKARKHKADLFVSIHADAFKNSKVSGGSVFVLSRRGASSEFARRIAASENSSDLVGGVTLSDKDDMLASVLLDLSQSAALEASNGVAGTVFASMGQLSKTHKQHVEHANFMVLKSPDVPSILVETGFISNPTEEKRLKDPAWQKKMAKAITEGIQDYFYLSPPQGTWIAANRKPVHYRVVRGDTLGEIASRYRVSLYSLRLANNLKTDNIRIGAQLLIPNT